jgi:hypothetical protein
MQLGLGIRQLGVGPLVNGENRQNLRRIYIYKRCLQKTYRLSRALACPVIAVCLHTGRVRGFHTWMLDLAFGTSVLLSKTKKESRAR